MAKKKKKDRLKFIDKLVSPDHDEKLGKIVDDHYIKMNAFYELTDVISDHNPTLDWSLEEYDEYLSVNFTVDDAESGYDLISIIKDFFSDKEDVFVVEITEHPHIVNITINTIVDEEEYFYERRPDTND